MDTIDTYLRGLSQRIQLAVDSGETLPKLARRAKVAPNTIREHRLKKWSPSTTSLRRVERALFKMGVW